MTSGISISTLEIGKKEPVGFIYALSGPPHSKVLTIDVAGCVSSGIVA